MNDPEGRPVVVEQIVDDPAGAAALIAAGGRLDRHSVAMVLDLTDAAPNRTLPAGFTIAPMHPGRSSEYGELVVRAYPPEHPDHGPTDADPSAAAESILHYLRGDEIGPCIAEASLHVTDHADRVVGIIVINETAASESFGAGPFVTDVCVDPADAGQGLGAALLLASADRLTGLGRPTLALAVTIGNPAQRLYERLGFRVVAESWRIEITD